MKKILLFTAFLLSVGLASAQHGNNGYYGQQHGQHGGYGQPQHNGNIGYNSGANYGPVVMTQHELARVRATIGRQSFERDKMITARSAVQNNLLLSEQVRVIASLFSFESSRLEIAKLAYTRVIDPQNYYVVNSVFRFSSSAHDLERYTASQVAYQAPGASCGTSMVYGQNGSTTYSGSITVTSGHGGMGINHGAAPAPMPACGMCQGHHSMDHMCPMSFARLISTINGKCFDNDKLMIAKQGIRGQLISADQVLQIMNLFSFDRYKLDFAKFAYLSTWNQNEYYIVNDGFTFNSSMRELDQYIRSLG